MEVWCLGGFDELLPPIAQLQPQRKAQVFEKLGFDVRFGVFCHYVQLLFVFELNKNRSQLRAEELQTVTR